MSLQDSLNVLQDKVKNFQNVVKARISTLGKFKVSVFKSSNQSEEMSLTMGFYFLRNMIKEMQSKSKNIKLKDFNPLQKTIKRFFQKFIETKELINFDKGEDLFQKLNENNSISPFKPLFCDDFQEKIKDDVFKDKCNELRESITNFNSFKEKFREVCSKNLYYETLREKLEKHQKILDSGNLKLINEESLEDFRLFRSFYPLKVNSEYLIDIKNKTIIKL